MKKLFILFVLFSLGVGIFLAVWNTGPKYEEVDLSTSMAPMPEMDAPNFRLPTLSGGYVELSQFKGKKPVLLYFWATWCPSCFQVRPLVEKLRKEIDTDKLEILAINVGANDSFERVIQYQKKHPLSMPVLYDRKSEVSATYGAYGVPLFVLIDKRGKLVYWGHELPDVRKWLVDKKKEG